MFVRRPGLAICCIRIWTTAKSEVNSKMCFYRNFKWSLKEHKLMERTYNCVLNITQTHTKINLRTPMWYNQDRFFQLFNITKLWRTIYTSSIYCIKILLPVKQLTKFTNFLKHIKALPNTWMEGTWISYTSMVLKCGTIDYYFIRAAISPKLKAFLFFESETYHPTQIAENSVSYWG